MHSTTFSAADPRVARRGVGAAAILAFLVLLLAGAARSTAGTDPALPPATPAGQSTPAQSQRTAPSPAQETAAAQPEQPSPSGHRPCPRHGGAGGGGAGPGVAGGAAATAAPGSAAAAPAAAGAKPRPHRRPRRHPCPRRARPAERTRERV